MSDEQTKYPELEKKAEVMDDARAIGAFIDWLRDDKDVVLAHRPTEVGTGVYYRYYHHDMRQLLAEFFDIDLQKMEEEKLALIEECRRAHAQQQEDK